MAENNVVNLDDTRKHEASYCVCIHCQNKYISVAVVGASWSRECPFCKKFGLYKWEQDKGEPPNYRQVDKCCFTCVNQSYERCKKYNRPITYDFICDDWSKESKYG